VTKLICQKVRSQLALKHSLKSRSRTQICTRIYIVCVSSPEFQTFENHFLYKTLHVYYILISIIVRGNQCPKMKQSGRGCGSPSGGAVGGGAIPKSTVGDQSKVQSSEEKMGRKVTVEDVKRISDFFAAMAVDEPDPTSAQKTPPKKPKRLVNLGHGFKYPDGIPGLGLGLAFEQYYPHSSVKGVPPPHILVNDEYIDSCTREYFTGHKCVCFTSKTLRIFIRTTKII